MARKIICQLTKVIYNLPAAGRFIFASELHLKLFYLVSELLNQYAKTELKWEKDSQN